MGAGESESESKETTLSIKQAEILEKRDRLFENTFLPDLLNKIEASNKINEIGAEIGQTSQIAQVGLSNVQRAFNAGSDQLQQSLARRGVTGGLQQQALAGLEVARAQSAADVSNQAFLQNLNQQNQLLAFSLAQSPQATTAVPLNQKTDTKPGGLKGLFS